MKYDVLCRQKILVYSHDTVGTWRKQKDTAYSD